MNWATSALFFHLLAQPAQEPTPTPAAQPSRVVLVLIDGVRWQDVFDADGSLFATKPALPRLQSLLAEGSLWGNRPAGVEGRGARTISLVPYSLPGYQSIFTGQQTPCEDNRCGGVTVDTFVDRFRNEGAAGNDDVAVFASWAGLSRAAARVPDRVHVDIPSWGTHEPGPPWDNARWDSGTWAEALRFEQKFAPRLLVVSLLDTDEFAHDGHQNGYRSALRAFDNQLFEFVEHLKSSGAWSRTTLVITTDHGRERNWRNHGDDDEGRDVFIGVFGARAPRQGRVDHSKDNAVTHADVRPTIEDALGLTPSRCASCGRSLLLPR